MIFTHSDITNNIIQIPDHIFYQVILPNAVEDALAKCKDMCTAENEAVPNVGMLTMCNKVCHLVISVLLFIHTDYHVHLVKTRFTGL